MVRYRDIKTLRDTLADIDKFIKKLGDAIKDEKDSQVMYIAMTKDATQMGRIEPAFTRMNTLISAITRDETRHEREYRVQSHKRTKPAMKKGPVVGPLTFFTPFQLPKIWR